MPILKILLFLTKSSWGVTLFSILGSGIFFTYELWQNINFYIVKLNEIKTIPLSLILLLIFVFLIGIILIFTKIPKMIAFGANKIIIELLAKIISNFFSSYLMIKASLLTATIFSLKPDFNGKLLNFALLKNDFSLYRNFDIIEKKQWLQEILEKITITEKDMNVHDIPWKQYLIKMIY